MVRIWKKIANFWYYYKWYVLGGLFLVGAVSFIAYDASRKPDPDLTICYIGDYAAQLGAEDALEAALAPYLTDVNGDGEIHINWIDFSMPDAEDLERKTTVDAQIPAIIAAAECKLFLVNETYADRLEELGVFEGDLVSLENAELFQNAGIYTSGMYAGVRVAPPQQSTFHAQTMENARAVCKMIKNEKKLDE